MSKQNGWVGYINIELGQADKKAVKENPITPVEWYDWVETQAAAGYKITVAYDHDRECFVATMTAQNQELDNYGYSMSQRHSTLPIALSALVYAHDKKADGSWASYDKVKQMKFNW